MRAILLAAGMGTRLRPITLETPKPLITVNGDTLIERQIKYLNEIGITDIVVVTGYLKDKFDFLKDKYGVTLVHNDMFDKYNNIYTMYLVKDYLADSYVIEGDIYLANNFLKSDVKSSTYFTAPKEKFSNEWMLNFDSTNKLTSIEVGSESNRYIMNGVSYWSADDAEFIISKLEKYIESGDFKDLFWDNIIMDNLDKLNIYIQKLESTDVFEIDSLEDLKNLQVNL